MHYYIIVLLYTLDLNFLTFFLLFLFFFVIFTFCIFVLLLGLLSCLSILITSGVATCSLDLGLIVVLGIVVVGKEDGADKNVDLMDSFLQELCKVDTLVNLVELALNNCLLPLVDLCQEIACLKNYFHNYICNHYFYNNLCFCQYS